MPKINSYKNMPKTSQNDGQRFYVYKCVWDDGKAPCIDNDLLTLTICKPYIRSTAKPGDVIFAFGSNNETDETLSNRLVYIAKVSYKLEDGKYFKGDKYKARQDCIYEWREEQFHLRCKEVHDDEKFRKSDLGEEPNYSKANTLFAEDFRYFGRLVTDVTKEWQLAAQKLCELVEGLGQGHRVNFTEALLSDLKKLKDRVWQEHPSQKVLGKPFHAPDKRVDSDPDESVLICRSRCDYFPLKKEDLL